MLKWLLKKLRCSSTCAFNPADVDTDELQRVDLSKFVLTKKDIIYIYNLVRNRPTIGRGQKLPKKSEI